MKSVLFCFQSSDGHMIVYVYDDAKMNNIKLIPLLIPSQNQDGRKIATYSQL